MQHQLTAGRGRPLRGSDFDTATAGLGWSETVGQHGAVIVCSRPPVDLGGRQLSGNGIGKSIRNVPQIPRPVDVAIQLHGATLVIHLRPAIAIGCLHDGCRGFAWKQHNRLVLACEQHPNRPH